MQWKKTEYQTVRGKQPDSKQNNFQELKLNFMLKVGLDLRNVIAIAICLTVTKVFSGCVKDNEPSAIWVADNNSLTQEVFADNAQGKSGVSFTSTAAWTSSLSCN